MEEQLPHLRAEASAAQLIEHLQRQQRVAAQREEVVAAADLVGRQAQHVGPDRGDGGLGLALRCLVGGCRCGVEFRRRQGLPIDLAAGVQRQRVEHHDGAGDHVLGQGPAERLA